MIKLVFIGLAIVAVVVVTYLFIRNNSKKVDKLNRVIKEFKK